jgi:hypothetical protein
MAPDTYATDDHWLIGPTILRYRQDRGLSEQQHAEQLGITVDRLRWLGLRTRPRAASPTFAWEVYRLARAIGCNEEALAEMLG